MNLTSALSISMISVGAVLLVLSLLATFKLLKILPSIRYKRSWELLIGLIFIFIIGYLIAIAGVIFENDSLLIYAAPIVFVFGALFVFYTVHLGRKTIRDLLNTSVSKNYVESIIKSMVDSLIVIKSDRKATIQTINDATTNLLHYKENELIGSSVSKIIDEHIISGTIIEGEMSPKTYSNYETIYRTKEGEKIPVSFSASPLRDFENKPIGIIYVAQDISERKAAERKIKEYVSQLKELNASKDRFFSIIAHDLKNPFSAVLGFSEILAEDAMGMEREEILEFSQNLHGQAKRVFDLLENLLHWSRIQTGRMKFEPEIFKLKELTSDVLDLYEFSAGKKNISLIDDTEEHQLAYADKDMIFTVLRNLVSNAIKFTRESGNIKLYAKAVDKLNIEITVEDDGVGMKPDDIDKLFRIDVHHSLKGTSDEEGTGLGLILCKELVEKNGGKIRVESEENKGSKFIFSLPVNV